MARLLLPPIALFFLMLNASALTIDSPASVPENISWSFSVKLDATDSWQKTSVKIGGAAVLDVYSNGTIIPDPFNGQFVLKSFAFDEDPKSTAGLVLFVSHIGLAKGEHSIEAASENSSDSKKIVAFAAIDESFKEDVNSRFSDVGEKLDSLGWKYNAQESRLEDLSIGLQGAVNSVSVLDSNISAFLRKVYGNSPDSIRSKIYYLEEWVSSIDTNQSRQEAALLAEEKARQKISLSGLYAFGSRIIAPLGFLFLIIVIILVIAGIVLVAREKLPSLGSIYHGKDEYDLPVSGNSEELTNALTGKGKFSFRKK